MTRFMPKHIHSNKAAYRTARCAKKQECCLRNAVSSAASQSFIGKRDEKGTEIDQEKINEKKRRKSQFHMLLLISSQPKRLGLYFHSLDAQVCYIDNVHM